MTDDKWKELQNAIILQAVEDYRKALTAKRGKINDIPVGVLKADCERFFKSKWFTFLSDIDGKELMQKLKGEAEMIEKYDGMRIASDAQIAISCLEAIIESKGHLHPNYLKEQVRTVQACLDFMKTFCEVEE